MLCVTDFPAFSQGHNTGMGERSAEKRVSLSERVFRLEKAHDACNVYLNYSGCGQVGDDADGWFSDFVCKNLRLEIKGNLNDRLYYRFRHRLNRSNDATDFDKFARATDIMMVGYRFNNHWALQVGKMCQYWGGFEFDSNPIFIHQFSDMMDNIDSPKAGFAVLYNPRDEHEFVVNVSDAINNSFFKDYPLAEAQGFRQSRSPIAAIANWNGKMCDGNLLSRWSVGVRHLARSTWSRQFVAGTKLNLSKLQAYLDYSYEKSTVDRIGIASRELAAMLPDNWGYFRNASYTSFVLKLDWQFAARWNLFAKSMSEYCHVKNISGTARKHYTYLAGAEFNPFDDQDLRLYAAYIGDTRRYSSSVPLGRNSTNRLEIGIIYRLKVL